MPCEAIGSARSSGARSRKRRPRSPTPSSALRSAGPELRWTLNQPEPARPRLQVARQVVGMVVFARPQALVERNDHLLPQGLLQLTLWPPPARRAERFGGREDVLRFESMRPRNEGKRQVVDRVAGHRPWIDDRA